MYHDKEGVQSRCLGSIAHVREGVDVTVDIARIDAIHTHETIHTSRDENNTKNTIDIAGIDATHTKNPQKRGEIKPQREGKPSKETKDKTKDHEQSINNNNKE